MFDQIWTDLSGSVESVVTGKDYILLGVMAVIAIAQGLTMSTWGQIWGRAGQSLIVVAVIMFVWGLIDGGQGFAWENIEAAGQKGWGSLMATTLKTLLGFYAVMFAAILVIKGVRSVVQR